MLCGMMTAPISPSAGTVAYDSAVKEKPSATCETDGGLMKKSMKKATVIMETRSTNSASSYGRREGGRSGRARVEICQKQHNKRRTNKPKALESE